MSRRVAVASRDGKYVNDHFGRARQFLIFDVNGKEYQFVELRENTPSCGGEEYEENRHQKTLELLSDCQAVIVSQIGPGAAAVLKQQGVAAFVIPDFIEEALKRLPDQSV